MLRVYLTFVKNLENQELRGGGGGKSLIVWRIRPLYTEKVTVFLIYKKVKHFKIIIFV